MQVKIKRLSENAVIPTKAHASDAGHDLTATSKSLGIGYIEYGTGLSMEIPEGFAGFLFPRSSISKKDLMLANAVGIIDAPYRGEIKLRFKFIPDSDGEFVYDYEVGDKIGQLIIMPIPSINFVEVEDLSITERGVGGFGSSDG